MRCKHPERQGHASRRAERVGVDTAMKIIKEAGLAHEVVRGSKHLMVVIKAPDGRQQRVTISGNPRSGETSLANMIRQQTTRAVRVLKSVA